MAAVRLRARSYRSPLQGLSKTTREEEHERLESMARVVCITDVDLAAVCRVLKEMVAHFVSRPRWIDTDALKLDTDDGGGGGGGDDDDDDDGRRE